MRNNLEINSSNVNGIVHDDQFDYNTRHLHSNVGDIVNETSNIDNSNCHHDIHPNPNNQNLNDNPEDKEDHVDYANDAADNDMNDQGVSNKTTNSERSSTNDSSKTVTNQKLILRLFMKKITIKNTLKN